MRPLTEEETKIFFEKLAKYIGSNIKLLLDRPDGQYVFRLQKERVYYVSDDIMRRATNFPRESLVGLGVCFGKFTKTKKFRITITALDYIAQYAQYKVWVKPSAEQSFLYGHHVVKAGLGRITEDTPQNQGVVVLNMSGMPLGFATTAKSTHECRRLDPTAIVCFHQADVGEYLREEGDITTGAV
eukprot:c7401_g1_i1.p1 GENE.c7401_g1_i1~~c7401_g1_i1.p1  ORF type:complete len:185 (-),score=32.87 c7401_g1_i1:176-730(-)